MARYWLTDPRPGDPWSALDQLRRGMDSLMEHWETGAVRQTGVFPPVNIYEAGDAYVLTAELPGLSSDQIEVSVEANRVTLRGERKIEYPAEAGRHRLERQAGFFRRTLELPLEVDAGKAEAVYRHGVLMLRIPKAPQHQPRRISVHTG